MKDITLSQLESEKQKCKDAIILAIATFQNNTGIMYFDVQLNGQVTNTKQGQVYSCAPSMRVTL